jgi:hypothetical protein
MTGAKAKLYIGEKLVGVFTNVSFGLTFDPKDVYELPRDLEAHGEQGVAPADPKLQGDAGGRADALDDDALDPGEG